MKFKTIESFKIFGENNFYTVELEPKENSLLCDYLAECSAVEKNLSQYFGDGLLVERRPFDRSVSHLVSIDIQTRSDEIDEIDLQDRDTWLDYDYMYFSRIFDGCSWEYAANFLDLLDAVMNKIFDD